MHILNFSQELANERKKTHPQNIFDADQFPKFGREVWVFEGVPSGFRNKKDTQLLEKSISYLNTGSLFVFTAPYEYGKKIN